MEISSDSSRIEEEYRSLPPLYFILTLIWFISVCSWTYVKSEFVFRDFGNVKVVGKSDLVTYKGPTMLASMLHSIAILLKLPKSWDWFINLSASDYPLMTQDVLLLILVFKDTQLSEIVSVPTLLPLLW